MQGNDNADTDRSSKERHSRTKGLYLDHPQQTCVGAACGSLSGRSTAMLAKYNEPLCFTWVEERTTTHDCGKRDDIVAAASICPAPACSSLVIEYRTAGSV